MPLSRRCTVGHRRRDPMEEAVSICDCNGTSCVDCMTRHADAELARLRAEVERLSDKLASLLDRVRPFSEAAPWVVKEIESIVKAAHSWDALPKCRVCSCTIIPGGCTAEKCKHPEMAKPAEPAKSKCSTCDGVNASWVRCPECGAGGA